MTKVPFGVRLASMLIPRGDRTAIVGDLLEDARWRGLSGTRQALSLTTECASIAAGFTLDRARTAMTLPPAREMAAGVAMDGGHALRVFRHAPRTILLRAALFCATVTLLALSVEVLVAVLMSAAGLNR
jgi:hypothetical protein